jgi:Tol biopolymer transport system component/DNA-binding winged helix-turn-helix (wHTH) protein
LSDLRVDIERFTYEFGPFRLDPTGHTLTRDGQPVALTPKTFDLLRLLVQSPSRAFSRQELISALWSDAFVEDGNLSFQVSALRKSLGEDGAQFIETVPKVGYRFVADVRVAGEVRATNESAVKASEAAPSKPSSHAPRWLAGAVVGVSALAGIVWLATGYGFGAGANASTAAMATPLTAYPGFERDPSLSPDGSLVAFEWNGPAGDNLDIYVKVVDSSEPQRLTTAPEPDMSPAWSPDGASIAFLRLQTSARSDLIVIPALGGRERIVAAIESGVTPTDVTQSFGLAWTRDGRGLVVGKQSTAGGSGLWVISEDDGRQHRLTEAPASMIDTDPAFSPDGRTLAFVRHGAQGRAIHVLRLSAGWTAAGAPTSVTTYPAIRGLAWSPDGTDLVFSQSGFFGSLRLARARNVASAAPRVELLPFGHGQKPTISKTGRLVYAAGSRDTNINELVLSAPSVGPVVLSALSSTLQEHAPVVSPDGRKIAFVSTRTGWEEIWIANRDGSNPRQMTKCEGPSCTTPRWSPDGRTIVFSSQQSGLQHLYLIHPDNAQITRLTDDPGSESDPWWSRDGRWIYFTSDRSGRHEVWRIPASGGSALQLTKEGGLSPAEGVDGYVYYSRNNPTAVWRVPIDGGPETLVADRLAFSRNFAVGEHGLYLMALDPSLGHPPLTWITPGPTLIDYIDFATRKRTTLARFDKTYSIGLTLTPDERSLLFSLVESAGSDLMRVDGFR